MTTELTEKTFDEAIKKPLVLVDFWASWCMPCRMLAPTIDQLSEEYKGKIFVGKVDIDLNPGLAEKYDVRSIPTLIIFKNGKAVNTIVGAVPKANIKAVLDKNLK
jgi:thioredoxin 1